MPTLDDEKLKRGDQIDARANEMFQHHPDLQDMEQRTGQNAGVNAGVDQAQAYANDPANASAGIDNARQQEASNNEYGYNPSSSGKQKVQGRMALVKKLGPTGIITLLFGGGGGILMTLLAPGIALIHVKEIVENKVNTMASVMETRSDRLMESRLLGGTDKAVSRGCTNGGLKLFCRYTKLSQVQVQALEANGITAKDSKHHVISSADLESGRVRPAFLELADGTPIKARDYSTAIRTSAEFRGAMRDVFPSRFAAWNDKIANSVATVQEWVRNPKTVGDEENGKPRTQQAIEEEFNRDLAEEQKGSDPYTGTNLDEGEFNSSISDETTQLNQGLQSGADTSLDTNTGNVLSNFKSVGASGFGKLKEIASSFVNPLSPVIAACTTQSYLKTIVTAEKIPAKIQEIRFATTILSTADKLKAGDATPSDVSNIMNMLEKENSAGKSFGDSAGYSYAEYGKTTSTPKEVGASGSWIGTFLSNALGYMSGSGLSKLARKSIPGTGVNVCSAATNPIGQIVSTIAGLAGGELVSAIKDGATPTIREAITLALKETSKKITSHFTEGSLKENLVKLSVMGGTFAGMFIASSLIAKYFTPFLAHLATGTLLSGTMDGVAAMDNFTSGVAAMNGSVAQERGMTALSPSQATAFLNFNNSNSATYVADREKSANPLDINNPYSASNQLGFSLGTFFNGINVAQNPGSILSLPSKVLSALNPANDSSSSVYAASTTTDQQALMNDCQDTDATQRGTIATDPFCNPIYGFDNISMLQNTDPGSVALWMNSNNYVDTNGNPTGNYSDYVNKCFKDASAQPIQPISSLVDNSLPEECYKPTGIDQTTYDYWHLYQIDSSVISTMDNGFQASGATS